jgi:sugar lactone lactonase YvrE
MTRMLLAVGALTVLLPTALTAATSQFPSRIDLPDGFQPEGIATAGVQFYVGSIPTGAVYRGSLRTGQGSVLVQPQSGRAAIGLKVDRGRLFVAGGPTGMAFVYNARTGAPIAAIALPTSGGTFVNDVVVTKRAAWFTDSQRAALYRLPLGPNGRPGPASAVTTVTLTGDYRHVAGQFNLNGIDATPNGKTLVVVQSVNGKLFTVTPAGVTDEIELAANESVPNGDGILLDGKTLYVVQNRLNQVARIALSAKLRSGRVVTRVGKPPLDLDVPTTIAEQGSRLYAVNARFGTPSPATADYWVTRLRK